MAQKTPSEDQAIQADRTTGPGGGSLSTISKAKAGNSLAPSSFLAELASTIESVVIPRLQLKIENGPDPMAIDQAMVRTFVDKLVRGESRDAMRHVEALLERGITMDNLLVDLLGPSARIMGEMWVEDSCNFVDVTLGMARIQHVFRQLRMPVDISEKFINSKGRALLVPAPGEQHVFGLRVVEEFLLRDGWDVDCRLQATLNDILYIVRDEAYDFVGFSLSGERLLEPLSSAIRLTRLNSKNRAIRIIVGGVYFADHLDAINEIDADAVACDARTAVQKANEWHETMRSAQ